MEYLYVDVAAERPQFGALGQPQLLIRDEHQEVRVVLAGGGDVVLQLVRNVLEGLLPAREVNGPDAVHAVARAVTVAAIIGTAERVGRIDVFVTLGVEDLGSEPLRRRLAVSPLQQALMGLINPHRFVLFGHGFPNRT